MSVLERCLSYRESNKRSKERQGPPLGVRFTEVSIKTKSTVPCLYDRLIIMNRILWQSGGCINRVTVVRKSYDVTFTQMMYKISKTLTE